MGFYIYLSLWLLRRPFAAWRPANESIIGADSLKGGRAGITGRGEAIHAE